MGALDSAMQEAASAVISALVDETSQLRRTLEDYSGATGYQPVGTASGYTIDGAHLANVTTVNVTGGSGAFVVGDQILIGTEKIRHRVATASATPAVTIELEGGLNFAQVGSESIVTVSTELMADVKMSPPESYRISLVDGTNIKRTDFLVIVPAKHLETYGAPENGDVHTHKGIDRAVVNVTPIYSGDDVATYELQVRA